MAESILIAEDEKAILRLLKTYFENEGFTVFSANDGKEAIDIYKSTKIDLVCLDVMMPKLNGFEVAQMIRSSADTPIIILTALDSEENILKGYSLYIDDYITKPFNPKVVVAKAKNLLLRRQDKEKIKKEYQIDELKINFIKEEVYLSNKKLVLTKTEFELLTYLINNQNKICSRELLLDEIWGMNVYVDNRIVDAYIKNLRKILAPKNYIKTIFKKGYMFSVE